MADKNYPGLKPFLKQLGLSPEESDIYKTLSLTGQQTALQLSRQTGISRTQIYRLLEKMHQRELVTEIVDEHRRLYQAVGPQDLRKLLTIKQAELRRLQELFPQVESFLLKAHSEKHSHTNVRYYRGQEGIRQMVWNVLKTKGGLVGYTYRSLESAIGSAYAKRLYEEIIFEKIGIRDIYSDAYIESMGSLEKAVAPPASLPRWHDLVESRYIPQAKLPIDHQMDIYNDTVALYNWHEGDVFGVEIQNEKIAGFQKRLFQLVWELAIPEKVLLQPGFKMPNQSQAS